MFAVEVEIWEQIINGGRPRGYRGEFREFVVTGCFTGHSEHPNGRYHGDTRRDNFGVCTCVY